MCGEIDLPVETGAGLLRVQAQVGADGKVATVRVDMGEPVITPALVPTTLGDERTRRQRPHHPPGRHEP